jgi:hypothetical protein
MHPSRVSHWQRDCVRIKASLDNCTYLEDSGIELYGYRFYGSPWQPKFHDWAFNKARGKPLRCALCSHALCAWPEAYC